MLALNIDESIQQEAKRYKKLFETFKVNPNHVRIEDIDYYISFYQKRITNNTEMVILTSPPKASKKKYEEAFNTLTFLIVISSNIKKYGTERRDIDMQAFYKTRTFLENVLDRAMLTQEERSSYKDCWDSLNTQIELQEKHIELMEEYTAHCKKKEREGLTFFPEDIEYAKEVFLEMDYIQYKQLVINRDSIDLFEKINQDQKSNETVGDLSNFEINQFIKEFAKGERKLTKEINSVTYVEGLEGMTKKEHKESVWNYFQSGQKKRINSMKKDIRYPKL